jgi:hypothetical protein
MEQLGLTFETYTNTTLHQFENALARMAALMYWAGMTMGFVYLLDTLISYFQRQTCNLTPGISLEWITRPQLTLPVHLCFKVRP